MKFLLTMHKQTPKRYNFILLCLAHAVSGLCWMMPLLLPFIREELHLSYTQGGVLLTCYSVFFLVFTILSGHLGDIYDARKILSFGFFLTACAFFLLLVVQSYFWILAALSVVGIGASFFYPVGMALISQRWQRGFSFGLFEVAGGIGIFATTLLFFSPLPVSLGWRLTTLILAIPHFLMGLVFLLSQVKLECKNTKDGPRKTSVEPKPILLFYLARGIQIFGGAAVMSFMSLFAVDVVGLPVERASLFYIFIWAGGIPAMLFYGILSDMYHPLRIIMVLLLFTIPTVFAITLPFPTLVIFPLLIIFGFCSVGAWVPQNMWLSQVTLQRVRGKVFGIALGLVGLANIASPAFFGFLADMWGLVAAFRLALFPMIVAALLLCKLASKKY